MLLVVLALAGLSRATVLEDTPGTRPGGQGTATTRLFPRHGHGSHGQHAVRAQLPDRQGGQAGNEAHANAEHHAVRQPKVFLAAPVRPLQWGRQGPDAAEPSEPPPLHRNRGPWSPVHDRGQLSPVAEVMAIAYLILLLCTATVLLIYWCLCGTAEPKQGHVPMARPRLPPPDPHWSVHSAPVGGAPLLVRC